MNRDTRGPRSMGRSTRGGSRGSRGGGGSKGGDGCLTAFAFVFVVALAAVSLIGLPLGWWG